MNESSYHCQRATQCWNLSTKGQLGVENTNRIVCMSGIVVASHKSHDHGCRASASPAALIDDCSPFTLQHTQSFAATWSSEIVTSSPVLTSTRVQWSWCLTVGCELSFQLKIVGEHRRNFTPKSYSCRREDAYATIIFPISQWVHAHSKHHTCMVFGMMIPNTIPVCCLEWWRYKKRNCHLDMTSINSDV